MASRRGVLLVFFTAIATVVSCFLVNATMVPFLNEINYTNSTDASFYIRANSLQVLARVPISILLGHISSVFGSVPTLGYSFVVAIVGILLLLLSRASVIVFLIAYLLSSVLLSVRVLRIAIISDLVSPASRTTFFALHQLMNPISNLLAPLCWIQIQRWTGSVSIMSNIIVLDRFSLSHLTAIVLLLVAFIISRSFLSEVEDTADAEPNSAATVQHPPESEPLLRETPRSQAPNSATNYTTLPIDEVVLGEPPNFSFYLAVSVLGRVSTSIAAVSFQPILVDIFLVSDARLGRIYLMAASLALGFPLISAFLSRFLSDKEVMLLGLLLKLGGNLLYLPLFGPVSVLQLVVAYVLTYRTAIFQTAALSSYTKTVRDRGSRKRGIANLNAGSNAAGALVRLVVAKWILLIFDSWWFALFTIPTILALLLVIINWNSLSSPASHDSSHGILRWNGKKSAPK